MTTPGQRIRAERLARGWSQQRLADEISRINRKRISRAAVALWENGSSKTQKPENFFAAAHALGLSPQWVLDETGPREFKTMQLSRDTTPAQWQCHETEKLLIIWRQLSLTDRQMIVAYAQGLADKSQTPRKANGVR